MFELRGEFGKSRMNGWWISEPDLRLSMYQSIQRMLIVRKIWSDGMQEHSTSNILATPIQLQTRSIHTFSIYKTILRFPNKQKEGKKTKLQLTINKNKKTESKNKIGDATRINKAKSLYKKYLYKCRFFQLCMLSVFCECSFIDFFPSSREKEKTNAIKSFHCLNVFFILLLFIPLHCTC